MHPRLKLALFCLFGLVALSVLAVSVLKPKNQQQGPPWGAVNRVAAKPAAPSSLPPGVPVEPRAGERQRHIHTAFRLSASGGFWNAPENLGVTKGGEVLAIHTHDGTGVVHLHRPQGVKPFTVAQVLSLWGIPVENGNILGYKAKIMVNRGSAPLSYQLRDRDDVIVYLPQGAKLPAFNWSQVPLERDK